VSGPSGVGKASVVAKVVWRWPQLFVSVSAREEFGAVGEFDATAVNDGVQRAAQELIALMGGTGRSMYPPRSSWHL
jgi:guanylate kinase